MDRIKATNSVAFAQADTAPSTGTAQYATSGNPASSTPATQFPAYAWNMIQDEIMKVITEAGITPDDTNWGQLYQAIQVLIAANAAGKVFIGGTSTGSANAQAVATTQGNFTNTAGNIGTFKAGYSNTGAMTVSYDGQTPLPLKVRGTSGLIDPAANAIEAGEEFMTECDGVNHQLVSQALNPAAFLQSASNLSDLGNPATALSNLGFTESFGTTGYQKLPGGLIIQWGNVLNSSIPVVGVSYPVTFPNNVYAVVATPHDTSDASVAFITSVTTSSFTWNPGNAGSYFYWIAIGR